MWEQQSGYFVFSPLQVWLQQITVNWYSSLGLFLVCYTSRAVGLMARLCVACQPRPGLRSGTLCSAKLRVKCKYVLRKYNGGWWECHFFLQAFGPKIKSLVKLKCLPDDGTKGEVKGHPSGTWMLVQHFSPSNSCWDLRKNLKATSSWGNQNASSGDLTYISKMSWFTIW